VTRSLVAFAALAVTPVGAAPLGVSGLGITCAAAADGPSVAVVVDFGDVAQSGPPPRSEPQATCVSHNSRLTGAQALVDAGYDLRFATSGLLCAINGYPADGCGERTGEGRQYLYWSYWRASSGETAWTYSGGNPASRIRDGVTEGWRFVHGTGSPSDPQPRHTPEHLAICGPISQPEPPSADGPVDDSPPSPRPPLDRSVAPPSSTVPDTPQPSADGSTTSVSSVPSPEDANGEELAVEAASSSADDDSASGALAAIAAVLLIVALAGAAFFRSRRTT
jgi:hypothetical protein